MRKSHFEVDKQGLGQIILRRGYGFIVRELIQNALDEKKNGVTRVNVRLVRQGPRSNLYTLTVEDDSPLGFDDLTKAFTLFRPSKKKDDPEQRGRFDLGEKLVIAASERTVITTTKGSIIFDAHGRTESSVRRERGTQVDVTLKMTPEQVAECTSAALMVLVPEGITLIFNEVTVAHREPLASFRLTLPTEIADEEGVLRARQRATEVRVYAVHPGEDPSLFEMGLVVVPTGDTYHVSVEQKLPVTLDRENVADSTILRRIRAAVLEHMHANLAPEQARSEWVNAALATGNVGPEAVRTVITARYGDKAVIRDIADKEANKIAVSQGYTVVEPGHFNKEQWNTIRAANDMLKERGEEPLLQTAGKVTPSPKAFEAGQPPVDFLPMEKWTPDMRQRAEHVRLLARELLGVPNLRVQIADDAKWKPDAAYGPVPGLYLNAAHLGASWFSGPMTVDVTALMIHEFAHHYEMDHLSREYYEACCKLGGRLALFALRHPDLFALEALPLPARATEQQAAHLP